MSRLGVGGLGLLVMLSQQPLEAQRLAIETSQGRQAREDVEFLRLYDEVKTLEDRLANEPPETENRHYTKTYVINGKSEEHLTTSGPATISEKILETKYKEAEKLADRYGISFEPNETGIFTWGDSLVIEKFVKGYVILNQNSAIVTDNSQLGNDQTKYHYSYQVLKAVPVKTEFTIVKGQVISDGFIPLFETPDFDGIARKIKELVRDNKHKYEYPDDPSHNINEVPEFQGLNYDNTRAHFALTQLTNIGMMLARMIEESPDLNGLPIPKVNMDKAIPRVGGNRIILAGKTFGDLYAKEENIRYELSLSGDLTLSIGPNGAVDYFFQRQCCIEDQKPVRRYLKIKFPDSK